MALSSPNSGRFRVYVAFANVACAERAKDANLESADEKAASSSAVHMDKSV